MKKIICMILCILMTLSIALTFSSCGKDSGNGGKTDSPEGSSAEADAVDVDITEATFKGWINEMGTSPEDFVGKTIRIEGEMYAYEASNGSTYYTVYRDGCCAGDHMYYLEFKTSQEKPANGEWIEVVGIFDDYTEGSDTYYQLTNAKITVKQERGTLQLGL